MLERLWKKTIHNKRFSPYSIVALLLWLITPVYRLLFLLKKATAGKPVKLPVPVIAVGNLSMGGSGKTPMVEYIAGDLLRDGFRVGIVSSGYGRPDKTSFVEPGYRVSRMQTDQTGDEVMLLARSLPDAIFSVDPNKTRAAQNLVREQEVDIVIVDDGYQHFTLARDLNLVTYDAGLKKRVLRLFPRGVLREPLSALNRAHVVVVTRVKFARDIHRLLKRLNEIHPRAEYYSAQFTADTLIGGDREWPVKYIEDKSVFIFAGIGNFTAFRKQVAALAADVDCAMELSDHQQYDPELLQEIKRRADECDSDVIITTCKDWVKLEGFDFGREIYYLNQNIDLDPGEEKLMRYVRTTLGLKRQDS